jgi:HK97 family phage major capsid protein
MKLKTGFLLALACTILMIGKMNGYGLEAMVLAGFVATLPLQWKYRPRLNIAGGDDEDEDDAAQKAFLKQVDKLTRKIVKDAVAGFMTEEEMQEKIDEWNEAAKKLNDENQKKVADKLLKEFKAKEDEWNKKLDDIAAKEVTHNETVNKLEGKIKAIQEGNGNKFDPSKGDKAINLRHALAEGFDKLIKERPEVAEVVEDKANGNYKSIAHFLKQGGKASFEIKAPVDMFESGIFADTATTQYALSEIVGPRVTIPLAVYPHVTQVFSVKNIRKPSMALMVMYGYEDGAATKTEGAASSKSSLLMKAVAFKAFYIATHFVLSDETMEDLDEVIDEIGSIGPDKVLSAVDSKVLGTGGDDVTDIKGIRTTGTTGKSTAFDAASAPDVPSGTAKRPDVYAAMKLQALNAGYKPNLLLISADDEFKIGADKNTLSDSRQDRRVAYGSEGLPTYTSGLRIAINNGIPANQAIVLDNSLAWIGIRRGLTVEIGLNGTDLVEGQRTIVIKIRVAFGVRDKAGIIWSSNVENAAAQMTPSA